MAAPTDTVLAPTGGVLAELNVSVGDVVDRGQTLLVVEVMKMEHQVSAPVAGRVAVIVAEIGDTVEAGAELLSLEPLGATDDGGPPTENSAADTEQIRQDLTEVLDRQRRARDAARPEAVAKRHDRGGRTARENLTDLVDAGSFVEYGALALAAQRGRRSEQELIDSTPADGLIGGIGRVNGTQFGDAGRCAVISYDYTVLAGTQGTIGHFKKDRLFELIERLRLPVILFAEGGGGRPGDTDVAMGSWLTARAFALWGRLSGKVPRIAIVAGRCFAGNAALAGTADLIIATEGSSLGMGGPAMIEGGGLGSFAPEEIGPIETQEANGTIDMRVADEREAVAVAKRLLGYFQGQAESWEAAEQEALRDLVPESRRRAYDVREVIETLFDTGSVTELRRGFGSGMITALARLEGRPVGVIGNDPQQLAGAITSPGADKAARFMQLCEAFGIPLISLIDTPGMMVGPEVEETALVRHSSRLFAIGPNLTVPFLVVVLGRAYGLGAQAMAGGGFWEPQLAVSWPTGELGPMGIEGAVRLGAKRELEQIEGEQEREQRIEELVADLRERFRAVNVATYFELDDVIDPVDTRRILAASLAAVPRPETPPERPWVDVW